MKGIALMLFALLSLAVLPGIAFSAASCSSYGESCSGGAGCCLGLVCDDSGANPSYKCNQRQGVCDITPQNWVFTPLSSTSATPGSVKGEIEQAQSGGGLINTGSGIYQVGWFNNWQTAGIIGVLIAVFLIAIAAIIGHSFNMPEVKAFVDAELMQAVVSVLLVVSMMGLIAFFDGMARRAILEGGTASACLDTGEPCYITVARSYLTTYYDMGSAYAQEALTNSVRFQNYANRGNSIQANLWWLGFAGVNFRLNAGLSIEAERAGAIFETMGKLLASIYAQRYFIDVVSYGIAPILLLLGILLRTFFFTRKLGGLLLAIALSLFIIYPLTYALAYYTLKVDFYGDRLTPQEPSCPAECKLQPPAAFYVDSNAAGEGHLVYFQQEADLVNAKVTKSNWGGNPDFPGLVACKELPNLPQGTDPSAVAPASECPKECPSYCREVPTPGTFPECQSAACGSCNPGCKIMRQRLDCKPGVCPTDPAKQCSRECKTKLAVENKCYVDQYQPPPGDKVQADLAVSCGGCAACPNWCLLRKPDPANPGQTIPAYNDAACNVPACKSPAQGGTCPDKCAYITEIGGDTNCNTQCSGCPLPCRVSLPQGMTQADFAKYDTQNFLPGYCSSFAAACSSCPNVCKTEIPQDPRDGAEQPPLCAPYPQNPAPPLECTSCPAYCRFGSYSFITAASNTQRDPDPGRNTPAVCASSQIKCSTPDCNLAGGCKATGTPKTCRPYDPTGNPTDLDNCKKCPMDCRKDPLPSGCDPIACKDISQGGFCPNECKVSAPGATAPVCSEYIGFGDPADFANHCWSENDPAGACWDLPIKCVQAGCRSGVPERCFGPPACTTDTAVKYVKTACEAKSSQGCIWTTAGDPAIPIDYRDQSSIAHPAEYYRERAECRQCPENCRIGDKENSCGISDNGADNKLKVDCSVAACASECRVQVPSSATSPPAPAYCKGYIPIETPGFGCPALCRRSPGQSDPSSIPNSNYCRGIAGCTDYNPNTFVGITDECRFPDAPDSACGECFDCPVDCLYTPAVRTDCSEVCGEGDLGAPEVDQQGLLKNLPGASGRTDVRNAGIFTLPALVLPLFNIVIIIAFIRVFSPTLGGDMEIPGLSRIL